MGSLYGGRFNRGSANDPALDDNRFLKCILQVIWRISKECFEHHITRAIRQILRNLTQSVSSKTNPNSTMFGYE